MLKTSKILFIVLVTLLSCENRNTEGKRLYQTHCINCHQEGGKGVGKLIPPISGEFLKQHHSEMPCIIKKGYKGKIVVDGTEYDHEMPGNIKISDFDLVNILNFIEEEFGSGEKENFNIEQVREDLQRCK